MEKVLIELISQSPIAVAIIVVVWMMLKRLDRFEEVLRDNASTCHQTCRDGIDVQKESIAGLSAVKIMLERIEEKL
jgi:hypothetical protein